jgi:hypothetical protein
VGTGYAWTLSVAGRASLPASLHTSFAPPVVTSILTDGRGTQADEPGAVPPAGGARVTLLGRNFGNDPSAVDVLWDGVPVGGTVTLASHSRLSFTSPAGQGAPAQLTLVVGGQATGWLAGLEVPTRMTLPYLRPRISSVSLVRGNGTEAVMDCSLADQDGRPVGGSAGALARVATLLLQGSNFGNGSDVNVSVRSAACEVVPGRVLDDVIVCRTSLCSGKNCRAARLAGKLQLLLQT